MVAFFDEVDNNAIKMKVGKNTYVSPTAKIVGENIRIGDGCYIGDGVQILVDDLIIGDYCKIHHNTTLHGYKPMRIGHNCWIGQGSIIDSVGGAVIGDNCGIGAYSQLWSHIRHGDPLEGCNYSSEKKLTVGKDVWFVGHCIVSPIDVEDRSMALVGSVVTRNMKRDRVYGGVPAVDLTGKVPTQFRAMSIKEKWQIIEGLDVPKSVEFLDTWDVELSPQKSYYHVLDRTYTKRGTDEEFAFMKYLQAKLLKFTPRV